MNSIPLTRLFFLLLLPVFLWSGCTGTKLLSRKSAEKDAAFYVNHLVENQIKADWMEARMKIQYEDKYMAVGGSVTVKMRKDSVIWLSVKKLGFEVKYADELDGHYDEVGQYIPYRWGKNSKYVTGMLLVG